MSLVSWFRHHKIDLEEDTLFEHRLYIPVVQLGIAKTVVVRTKRNGGVNG